MGKIFARPSQEGPIPPWFGQPEMLEDNDVIDRTLPPSVASLDRERYRNSLFEPANDSPLGNFRFGQLRGGHRPLSAFSDRLGRSRKSTSYHTPRLSDDDVPRESERGFPDSPFTRRFLYSQNVEESSSSESAGERILHQSFLDRLTRPPSRSRSSEGPGLEVDEPRRWVDPTPIPFSHAKKKAQARNIPPSAKSPKPNGENGPPKIHFSRLIPCGKVNVGGQTAPNPGLYYRKSSRAHNPGGDIVPTIEGDENRPPNARQEALQAIANAAIYQDQGRTRERGDGPYAPQVANAIQAGQGQAQLYLGPLRDSVPETSEESDSAPNLQSAEKSSPGWDLEFPKCKLLVIRPARPKALTLKMDSTPADMAEIVRTFWPRIPPGRRDFEVGYDDDDNEKRWLLFSKARDQPAWPAYFVDALQGRSEVIINLPFDTITVKGNLRGIIDKGSDTEQEEESEDDFPLPQEPPKLEYKKITVAELKKRLADFHQSVKGKKAELFDRYKSFVENRARGERIHYETMKALRSARKNAEKRIQESQIGRKDFQEATWHVPPKAKAGAWAPAEMARNLEYFKKALVSLSGGRRRMDINLPPLKIQVDRYKDEWLRWDMYMGPSDFHHDVFLKIDDPVINVYNVLTDPDEPYDLTPSVSSTEEANHDGTPKSLEGEARSPPSYEPSKPTAAAVAAAAAAGEWRPKEAPGAPKSTDGEYRDGAQPDSSEESEGPRTPPDDDDDELAGEPIGSKEAPAKGKGRAKNLKVAAPVRKPGRAPKRRRTGG